MTSYHLFQEDPDFSVYTNHCRSAIWVFKLFCFGVIVKRACDLVVWLFSADDSVFVIKEPLDCTGCSC